MSRTVIIDGDIVINKVCHGLEDNYEIETEEDDEYIIRTIGWANKKQAKDYLLDSLDNICSSCKGDSFVVALSDKETNFRKEINPSYKRHRKTIKPILYFFLRDFLYQTELKVYERPGLEADDIIGILATSEKIIKGDKVVWSLDKDFKTIPCKFHKAKPDGSHESKVITLEEADWWFMYQTLIGDKVDGYDGCKGVGDKTARRILGEPGEKSLERMWKEVKKTYVKCGFSEETALQNARMARILRASDYDFKEKKVKLWNS